MEKWVVASKKADYKKIGIEFGIDPIVARLLCNRGIEGTEAINRYLYGTLKDIPSPWLMKDMETAVALLSEAISNEENIRIIGDYDVDGICASYILLSGLARLGASVDVVLPERELDGYGMNEAMVEESAGEEISLILTCDNGISQNEAIDRAKELGMKVVVTDHHEVPTQLLGGFERQVLPNADAILDPKRADETYPYHFLCGAGVAYKLMCAMYERYDCAIEEEDFLEFVSMATITDLVPLTGENRILAKEGLSLLQDTRNLGLMALKSATNLLGKELTTHQVGYTLGPIINASGRLSSPHKALSLFLAEDKAQASELASELYDLNETRKEMTVEGTEQALQTIMNSPSLRMSKVLVLFLPQVNESLAGIIAGTIKDRFHRPTFVITRSQNGGLKGSGRSIEAYPMVKRLQECSDLLTKFGGHAMAAGLSLEEENLEALRERLNERCGLRNEDLVDVITVDASVPMAYFSKRLVSQIDMLAPFGVGNEKPLFAQKNMRVVDSRVVGRTKGALRMRLTDENGVSMAAVYFGEDAEKFFQDLHQKQRVAVTFYPYINLYQGRESLQLVVQNYKVY